MIEVSEHLETWGSGYRQRDWEASYKLQMHNHMCKAMEVATRINVHKLTNKQIRKNLNLKNDGATEMDALEIEILDSYFGEYSASTKACKT